MNFFARITKRLFMPEQKKVMGRWTIDNSSKKTDLKIDLSNEDHCGPCGQYMLEKKETRDIEKNKTK
jgi:hypothetical protein